MADTYDGIDYGLGKTNLDTETGIRFGIIHNHRLVDWFWDETEAEYGDCESEEEFAEPIGHNITDPEITASVDSSGDVWVFRSNYITRGTFCSPCAPGAVSIGTSGGVKCYCLPPDWYAEGERPEGIEHLDSDENLEVAK